MYLYLHLYRPQQKLIQFPKADLIQLSKNMAKQPNPALFTFSRIVLVLTIGVGAYTQNIKRCGSSSSDSSQTITPICPNNCQTCINATSLCLNCQSGFYLVNDQCYPCLLNCKTCSSIYTCDNCQTGYTYSSNSNACVSIECTQTYCVSCSSIKNYTVCSLCADGYMLKDSLCVICTKGCSDCSNNICQSCVPGYYRSALSCLPCMSSCVTCNDSSSCAVCANEYTYNPQQRFCYLNQTSSTKSKLLAILIPIAAVLILAVIIICLCKWKRRKNNSSTQVVESDLLDSMNRLQIEGMEQCGSQQAREWLREECPICMHLECDARTTCRHYFHLKCLLAWKALKQTCPSCCSRNIGIKAICKKCNSKILGISKDMNTVIQQVICPECNQKTAPSI